MLIRRTVRTLFTLAVGLGALVAVPSTLAAVCPPTWEVVATPSYATGEDTFNSASVVSDTDIWASGQSDAGGFVQHWDGTSWTTRLGPIGTDNYYGIASAGSDVWVVGEFVTSTGDFKTRIRRWDGVSWTTTPSPSPGKDARLEAVAALAPNDVWAVGQFDGPATLDSEPLILHWNGASWQTSTAPVPSGGINGFLASVVAKAANDVWAFGRYLDGSTESTLVMHWNGSSWSSTQGANTSVDRNVLQGGAALASNDVWAAGFSEDWPTKSLINHWNGTSWSAATGLPASPGADHLAGVAALGRQDVWAVGSFNDSTALVRTLVLHWTGASWRTFVSPNVSSGYEGFRAVASTPGGNLWALGGRQNGLATLAERLCPIKVRDSGFSVSTATVRQASAVAWSFPSYNLAGHSVVDDSGLNLFGSAVTAPGGSYFFRFNAAGTYPVVDPGTPGSSSIAVPLIVGPAPGLAANVRWSAAAPPAGLVFDVQVRKPATLSYTNWKSGVTTLSGTYTAASAGTYRFRARLRDPSAGGQASDWSPIAAFLIN
jgi:hypothetical protein